MADIANQSWLHPGINDSDHAGGWLRVSSCAKLCSKRICGSGQIIII